VSSSLDKRKPLRKEMIGTGKVFNREVKINLREIRMVLREGPSQKI
jgi:hypothetical protein